MSEEVLEFLANDCDMERWVAETGQRIFRM